MQLIGLNITRDGGWFVIADKAFGITTQGKTQSDAVSNYLDAFHTCFEDADWRRLHNLNESAKLAFSIDSPKSVQMVVVQLAEASSRLRPKARARSVQPLGL
ncbi:Uncharacterised protein [uncultured archaeon]|nr:Uncharacterised protein [uncultured archaeon]